MKQKSFRSILPLFEEGARGSLLLIALLSALSLNAQMLKVYKGGAMVYCQENADSVVFCSLPEDVVPGAFSVSATKQVRFSKGNLQYTQSTQTWSFADNQYDMIGEANISNGVLADKIDLFGWSGSTGTAQWGVSTSTDYSDYSGDFVDWGKNIGDGNTWYTLTYAEWSYLLNERTSADQLKGVARILLGGNQYANGLVLLPDSWTCPAGIVFKSGFANEKSAQAYADYQTFTLADWQKLESAGAVFFPASGIRLGPTVYNVQYYCYCWSATPDGPAYAKVFLFRSEGAYLSNNDRSIVQAVRLVRDL